MPQQPFIGQIMIGGFNFPPQGWAFCNGQLMPISQNTALFSLLGTTFGGNGTTTFALPDLRGRIPVHNGQGTGLSNYNLGDTAGVETVTLTPDQLPAHTHAAQATTAIGNTAGRSGTVWAKPAGNDNIYSSAAPSQVLSGNAVGPVGGQPHENRQPLLALNYCIALFGIFPSRS